MITTAQMYWITISSHIQVLCVIMSAMSLITILMVFGVHSENLISEKLAHGLLKTSFTALVFFILGATFIPSTKELAAIIVVPKIVNNENVQNLGDNVMRLVNEWAVELLPNKNAK